MLSLVRNRERIDITLLLSMSIMSEYILLVYTLMHSIIGHISINVTSNPAEKRAMQGRVRARHKTLNGQLKS